MVNSDFKYTRHFFVGLLLFLVTKMSIAAITVSVDRSPVVIDESFQIIFESDSSVNDEPDFTSLRNDFDILSQSHRSSINMINGHYSRSTRWILDVMARRTGALTIPSIKFGNERSPTKTIEVEDAPQTGAGPAKEDIFFEVDATPRNPYVQAQVIYTLRLFRAVNTHNSDLTEPRLSGAKAIVEKLDDDKSYEHYRDGKRYLVVERKYAIFPQSSGLITIEPFVYTGRMGVGRQFLFDSFGNKPSILRKFSEKIELNARPIPSTFNARSWLPASQLQLSEAWSEDPPVFKVGEPVTRTLALIAGGLTAGQLPPLKPNLPRDFKQYPDQPALDDKPNPDGIVGIRQEKIALIPAKAGNYILPAIEIPWWNTQTDQLEYARITQRKIKVQAANLGTQSSSPPEVSPTPGTSANVTQPALSKPTPSVDTDSDNALIIWILVSTFLAVGWSSTVGLWWLKTRDRSRIKPLEKNRASLKQSIKWVKQSCTRNQPLATKDVLLQWASIQWPENPPTSLGGLGDRCSGALKQEINILNQALYANHSESWQGADLSKAFMQTIAVNTKPRESIHDGLEPLYRIQATN